LKALVQVENVSKEYKMGESACQVLSHLSFSISKGEIVGIVGESGSGKSTLLHILGTLEKPTKGKVFIEGEDIFQKNDTSLSHFRNRFVGFVFQDHNLMPEFSALENVMLPGIIAGKPPKDLKKRACELLDLVNLSHRMNHQPHQMSGGEQQRVTIARALFNEPLLVLADEPSGSLDSKNAQTIYEIFEMINRTFKTTLIVVTHNKEYAQSLNRRLVLKDGILISDEKKD
jgi:lipoprotein-releasing system ATP-binding protein